MLDNPTATGARRPRVALYSHDAQGLGHTRRNLAIATALGRTRPRPDVLLLTGAPEAATGLRPPGCDLVGLPGMTKDADGTYTARDLSTDIGDLVALRSSILVSALHQFSPDLLIVDKHPRGAFGELEPALRALAARGTRLVLGLRDVLDHPVTAARQWRQDRGTDALDRWYDAVWVYGDRRIHDPTTDLDLPAALRRRVHHVGYLAPRGHPTAPRSCPPYLLGLAGGGGDGIDLAECFARTVLPAGMHGVFVTGPHMPPEDRDRLARLVRVRPEIRTFEFVPDLAPWLDHAAAVISMGGYNTVCEVLSRPVPLLVVPRGHPRREQLLRAQRLAGVGALDMLHPDLLDPYHLEAWVAGAASSPVQGRSRIDLAGMDRVPGLAASLVAAGPTGTSPGTNPNGDSPYGSSPGGDSPDGSSAGGDSAGGSSAGGSNTMERHRVAV